MDCTSGRKPFGLLALILTCGVGAVSTAWAGQGAGDVTATIMGRITDQSGAVLPGVTVSARSPALQLPEVLSVADAQGEYRLSPLPIGTYRVSYTLPGFQGVIRDDLRLTAGFVARVDIALRVGAVEETVTVSGASPVVDVSSSGSQAVFTRENLELIPTGRTGWVSLLNQSPSVRSNLDIGGVSAAATPVIRVYGVDSESWQVIEGIVTTDTRTTQTGNYLDYQSFEEGRIQTIANQAEVPARGAYVNIIVKSGGNEFHGTGSVGYMSDTLQSDNVTDELRARGITSGNPLNVRRDVGWDLGGRLIRDKLWFYEGTRFREQDLQKLDAFKPDGSPANNYQSQIMQTVKLSYQVTPGNKLIGFYNWQRKREYGLNISINVPWESRRDTTVPTNLAKVEWQGVRGNSLFTSVQVGHWDWRGSYFANTDGPETTDIFTQRTSGISTDTGNIAKGWRNYMLAARATWFNPGLPGGSHELKAGFDYLPTVSGRQWLSRDAGDYRRVFNDGAPYQIIAFNYPVDPRTSANATAVHLSDSWHVSRQLTLNLGVRYARDNGFVPEQCRAAGTFAAAACTEKIQFNIWNSLSPRLYAAYDVSGGGASVLKGGWGRFAHWRLTDEVLPANPFIGTQTTYRWRDLNGNRDYDAGEVNLDTSGPDFVSRAVRDAGGATGGVPNPDEQQPAEDQFSLSYERQMAGSLAVRVSGIYSRRYNIGRVLYTRRPFDAYNVAVTRPDPGPDGRVGTTDDPGSQVTYYEYPRELAGVAFQENTRVADPDLTHTYRTIEVAATKRLSSRWQFMGSYSATRLNVPVPAESEFTPNAEIFADNRSWEWLARASAAYQFPFGLTASTNVDHRSGTPLARQALFTGGVTIPSIVLNVEPVGSIRLPNATIVDVRVEKSVSMPGAGRVTLRANLFNVLNSSVITGLNVRSGPTYLRPTSIVLPRILEVGATYSF